METATQMDSAAVAGERDVHSAWRGCLMERQSVESGRVDAHDLVEKKGTGPVEQEQ